MVHIAVATERDVDSVVGLEGRLFAEDAGVYEPFADVGWPAREGADDCRRLIDDPNGIVLLARDAEADVGLLMGYSADASSTRQPVRYAVLRTMYVASTHRRDGIARQLTERFLEWAREAGCAEAQVNHYAANTGAGLLYEQCGFEAHSLNRVLLLD